MKGKISNQRTPIIFAGVTGKKITVNAKKTVNLNTKNEVAEAPTDWGSEFIVFLKENELLDKFMDTAKIKDTKMAEIFYETLKDAKNPTYYIDIIKEYGYYKPFLEVLKEAELLEVFSEQLGIDFKTAYIVESANEAFQEQHTITDDTVHILPVIDYANKANTTQSNDKKLLFLGVGLGLGILLLTLNN